MRGRQLGEQPQAGRLPAFNREMLELFYEYSKRWQHNLKKQAFAGDPHPL